LESADLEIVLERESEEFASSFAVVAAVVVVFVARPSNALFAESTRDCTVELRALQAGTGRYRKVGKLPINETITQE
jgi:hypothetical protein